MKLSHLAVLLMGTLQSALLSCLPLLIAVTPLTTSQWSWLIGGSLLGFVVGGPTWGRLTDRFSPQRTLLWTFTGLCLAHGLLLVAIGLPLPALGVLLLLIASRVVYAVFTSGLFGAAQASVLLNKPTDIRSNLAKLNAVSQLGRLLGPLAVVFCAWYHPLAALYVLGAIALIVLVATMLKQAETISSAEAESPHPFQEDSPGLKTRFRIRLALPELAMAFVLTGFLGCLQFLLGPYLQHHFRLSPESATQHLSMLLILTAMIMFLGALVLVPRLQYQPRIYLLTMLSSCVIGGLLLGSADGLPMLVLGLVLLAIGVSLCTPYYGQQLRDQWPQQQGMVGGALTSAHTLGYGAGTLVGGWLMTHYADQALDGFYVLGPLLLLLTGWQWLQHQRRIHSIPGNCGNQKYFIANDNDCDLN